VNYFTLHSDHGKFPWLLSTPTTVHKPRHAGISQSVVMSIINDNGSL